MLCLTQALHAQTHPSVPTFNSLPGAPYTLYLDFGGFSFNGNWNNAAGATPGVTPAYDVDSDPATFSATELANIQNIWSRVSEKYAPFNINVSTVDPAVAAGQNANDTQRQDFYDSQADLMHTVIGGNGSWTMGGGISYVGVTSSSWPGSNGLHTNWVFSALAPNNLQFVAEASAHENGHGLGLQHQSDYNGNVLLNEYSLGSGSGAGSVAPTMGNSYSAERGAWKLGTANNPVNPSGPTTQNDPLIILNNPGLGTFINDGIGHTMGAATPLPLNGLNVNSTTAKGIIVPASSSNPTPTGSANYTTDLWSFTTGTGLVSFTVHSGRSTITPGVADPGATLDATLRILNSGGTPVATANTSSLSESLTNVLLTGGNYFVQITSAGATLNQGFYDMGSYFLSGTIVAVPEPSTFVLAAAGLMALAWRLKRHGRA